MNFHHFQHTNIAQYEIRLKVNQYGEYMGYVREGSSSLRIRTCTNFWLPKISVQMGAMVFQLVSTTISNNEVWIIILLSKE